MRFYFLNSRLPVPEPFYTLTMRWGWFAAAQCTGSVLFELSTCLLFWRPYRLVFPLLATAFHGVIWYTARAASACPHPCPHPSRAS